MGGATSRLLVKADEKTTTFVQGWAEIKKQEWAGRQTKAGVEIDWADLEQKEALGEILPFEKELIPDYAQQQARLDRLLQH